MRKRLVILLALAASAVLPATAGAAGAVPEGAEWSEATIPSTDGVKLHADILRPRDLPRDTKSPRSRSTTSTATSTATASGA